MQLLEEAKYISGACPGNIFRKNFLLLSCDEKVHLTREQRYAISAFHKQGCTQTKIAQAIGKDESVVSRELKRNVSIPSSQPRRCQSCAKSA